MTGIEPVWTAWKVGPRTIPGDPEILIRCYLWPVILEPIEPLGTPRAPAASFLKSIVCSAARTDEPGRCRWLGSPVLPTPCWRPTSDDFEMVSEDRMHHAATDGSVHGGSVTDRHLVDDQDRTSGVRRHFRALGVTLSLVVGLLSVQNSEKRRHTNT